MQAENGKGQVCPLLVQIKILRPGEGRPTIDAAAGFLRRGHVPAHSRASPGEVWGRENREGLCTPFPGTVKDSARQERDCQGMWTAE